MAIKTPETKEISNENMKNAIIIIAIIGIGYYIYTKKYNTKNKINNDKRESLRSRVHDQKGSP